MKSDRNRNKCIEGVGAFFVVFSFSFFFFYDRSRIRCRLSRRIVIKKLCFLPLVVRAVIGYTRNEICFSFTTRSFFLFFEEKNVNRLIKFSS